jgi:hypothetical protein
MAGEGGGQFVGPTTYVVRWADDRRQTDIQKPLSERMARAQTGELFVIGIGGDPFAIRLNGQGRKPDIGNQVAGGREGLAKAGKNLPVT